MKIVMITENDPAGMGIAFTRAINRYTDHHCRLISTGTRYNFEFEKDFHIPDLKGKEFDQIETCLKEADIFHFHLLSDESIQVGPLHVRQYVKGKAILHHHHGHPHFRSNPDFFRAKYNRLNRKALVSTPDLLKLLPEADWIPNLVPLHESEYLPLKEKSDKYIRICHSPTRKELKNTTEFVEAVKILMSRYLNIRYEIIENRLHRECLKCKQTCDIHFDHMQGYFGVSSLESLSQGRPVIAGLDEWNISHIKDFAGTDWLPWVIARTLRELEKKLEELIIDNDLREKTGARSREFMLACWSEQKILERLIGVYQRL